jgi:DNA polymerase IV
MPRYRPSLHLPLNSEQPQILHIDLNSCFATVEQQARPTLRGRPLGVTNRLTKNACVVAASYEAKSQGVKVGMTFSQARLLCPDLLMVETDPPKYHYVYKKLVKIMRSYSPNIGMKSIDEGIIDFHGTRQNVNKRPLVVIGQEIKQRLRDDVGCWMKCNIGIAPNRFLAKTAASLHKPDGLDIITYKNLRQTLSSLELTDLTGIAARNQARLNAAGIFTPLQFLDAPSELLVRKVFHSVCGDDWYRRLRGWETDDAEHDTKTIGRQFVMDDYSASEEKVRNRLAHLCESTGLKLRHKGFCARGISLYIQYKTGDAWHSRQAFKSTFYTTPEIFRRALLLFNQHPRHDYIVMLSVSCYLLEPSVSNQMSILEEVNKEAYLSEAIDEINDRYGNYTVTFANSLGADKQIKQKIPFGSTRYFELLCNRA